jgi:hypothetical protein
MDEMIPNEGKGDYLSHSAFKVVGGPDEKKIVESPDDHKEFDRLKGAQQITTEGDRINISSSNRLVVNIEATKIEKFFVEGLLFTQLSDHYGISAQLEII